jgi:hypothetical protein
MGLFGNIEPYNWNPKDVTVATSEGYTSAPMLGASAGYGGMISGLGRLAGFQTEEDMLKEIYENADFDTEEGINDVIQKVMAINPEKGAALQKQVTERSIASTQKATAELATETAKLQNIMIKHGTKLNREFTMTPNDGGLKATIAQWLIINNIDLKGTNPPSTFVGALKYVYDQYQDDTTYANQLRDDLKAQIAAAKDAWVQAGALAILEGEVAPETYSAEETFSAPLLSDAEDWQEYLRKKEEENRKNLVSSKVLGMSRAANIGIAAS